MLLKRWASAFFILTLFSLLSCRLENEQSASHVASAGAPCVYMQVIASAPDGGVQAYFDEAKKKSAGYVGPSMPVVRQLTLQNAVGETMMRVRVGYGSMTGKVVWMLADNLEVRPNYGGCRRELSNSGDYASNPNGGFLRSTVMCFIGLGDGAIGSAKGVATGVWSMASGVVSRNVDIIRWLSGDVQAEARLIQAGEQDEKMATALVTLATNAVPAMHNYLAGEYAYYKDLPPARQSEMLCQVLGAVSLEVLTTAALAGGQVSTKVTSQGGAIVRVDNGVVSIVKQKLGKHADEIDTAAGRAGAKRPGSTSRAIAGGTSVLERFNNEAIEAARKVLSRCGTSAAAQPLTCLGLGANATKNEIKSAYRKLSMEVHPDSWQGKARQLGVPFAGEAQQKMQTAQAALNLAFEAASK